MKRIICMLIILTMMITGCGKEENVVKEQAIEKTEIKEKAATKENTITTEKGITLENTSEKVTGGVNKRNIAKKKENKTEEELYLLTEGKELTLKNLINNKVINKYQLNKKQCVSSKIKIDEGYCVQIYKANREIKDQVIQGDTVEDTPEESEIVNVSMKFFDKELNETDTVDVSKLAKERKNEDFLMANFTVSPDGVKIAWDTGESILCYDRKTKKFAEYNQLTEKDIVTENIIFAGNDKLAFYGSKGESEEDTCYGYLNLTDKKAHFFIEKKYEAFSLKADKRYIWLNDGENPEDKTASGKMPIVDTKTGKNQLVHLDNIESTKASITEDGKYIIAVSQTEENSFRVRQYDAESEKVLKEKKYDFSETVHVSDIISINDGKSYGIIYGTDKGDKLEKFELK